MLETPREMFRLAGLLRPVYFILGEYKIPKIVQSDDIKVLYRFGIVFETVRFNCKHIQGIS